MYNLEACSSSDFDFTVWTYVHTYVAYKTKHWQGVNFGNRQIHQNTFALFYLKFTKLSHNIQIIYRSLSHAVSIQHPTNTLHLSSSPTACKCTSYRQSELSWQWRWQESLWWVQWMMEQYKLVEVC